MAARPVSVEALWPHVPRPQETDFYISALRDAQAIAADLKPAEFPQRRFT